ncbi:MAG: protein translocase subunit SecD [Myxococcota bacterium]|nr:protein translocase subunit SecD [Myxococcota bacterium]
MERGIRSRLLVVASVIGCSIYLLYPSIYFFGSATEAEKATHEKFCEALPGWFNCAKINLGLDLQGGVHLVLGVGVEKALEQRLDRLADGLQSNLEEKKWKSATAVRDEGSKRITANLAKDNVSAFETFIRSDYSVLTIVGRSDDAIFLELTPEEQARVETMALDQTIKTLRNRADKFGVTEPTIAKRGKSGIVIQLPGVKDPQRAIDMIGKTAQLAFKIVDPAATKVFETIELSTLPEGTTRQSARFDGKGGSIQEDFYFELAPKDKAAVRAVLKPLLAADRQLAFSDGSAEPGAKLRTYVLYRKAGITGDYLTDAFVDRNPDIPTDYYVSMQFDQKGAKVFADLTEKHARDKMAIVLDDVVSSAPQIEGKIPGGSARVTLGGYGDGRKKFEEATDLALVLKAGALPAPVEIREKRQVGQTLGEQSVRGGAYAIALGAILVLIFMLIYYKLSGFIADFALVLNILLVLAVLSLFEATLTLPGMAGIVLTIGMAVDANVIIFERIREELRIGKSARAAVDGGYSKAFGTILDANITTLLACVVLYQYGSGPVRGFAVTLMVGIVCSMFTAIVVTRLVFDISTSRARFKTLSI